MTPFIIDFIFYFPVITWIHTQVKFSSVVSLKRLFLKLLVIMWDCKIPGLRV